MHLILKNIQKFCKQDNISISKLERELGFGNGSIRKWDACSPSVVNLKKVSDYFHILVDDLIEESEK